MDDGHNGAGLTVNLGRADVSRLFAEENTGNTITMYGQPDLCEETRPAIRASVKIEDLVSRGEMIDPETAAIFTKHYGELELRRAYLGGGTQGFHPTSCTIAIAEDLTIENTTGQAIWFDNDPEVTVRRALIRNAIGFGIRHVPDSPRRTEFFDLTIEQTQRDGIRRGIALDVGEKAVLRVERFVISDSDFRAVDLRGHTRAVTFLDGRIDGAETGVRLGPAADPERVLRRVVIKNADTTVEITD